MNLDIFEKSLRQHNPKEETLTIEYICMRFWLA